MLPDLSSRALLPALVLTALPALAQGDRWLTIDSTDNNLRRVDPYTGTTLQSIGITATTGTVNGCNGLAVHPTTGELWVILQIQGQAASRTLAKLNPTTGAATPVGQMGDRFAGIAFDAAGTLYGVTGDGATTPETLYTINQSNAQPTSFLTLGNGTDGEAIGFHPPTGLMFHASGIGARNGPEILETINLQTRTITPVSMSVGEWEEALAITHFTGPNMLVVDLNADVFVLAPSGAINSISTLDHFPKGIVNLKTTGGAYFTVFGGGCPAANGLIPVLGGSGTPAGNARVDLRYRNGPAMAPAVLALGLGTQTFQLTPACSLQNLPLSAIIVPLTLSAMGDADLGLTIPVLPAFDFYFQGGQVASNVLALTNPLRTHVQ
jgi:hypothetical protein